MENELKKYCQGISDSWDRSQRLASVQKCFDKINLEGKTILETGSRYGLISYMAMLSGAEHVTGVEIDSKLSDTAKELFASTEFESTFLNQNIFDHVGMYDLVLYLGLFYNIPNSETLLRRFHHCSQILVEAHLPSQNTGHPMSDWISGSRLIEMGDNEGKYVKFQQYFSNHKWLQQAFKRSGFSYELIEQSGLNCFYLLTPNKPTEQTNRWGTYKKSSHASFKVL